MFAAFYDRVKTAQLWCQRSRCLVKEYYKTIDLKNNQLHLIESSLTGKAFDDSNPFSTKEDQSVGVKPPSAASSGKKTGNDYAKLLTVVLQAEENSTAQGQVLRQTSEFRHLVKIKEKLESVRQDIETTVKKLTSDKSEVQEQSQLLAKLDSLLAIGVPLCPRFQESTTKTIKIAKWKLRLEKLRLSKTVTIKQLESLLKEAKSQVVSEDDDCKREAALVEE